MRLTKAMQKTKAVRRAVRRKTMMMPPWIHRISDTKLKQDMKTLILTWMKNPRSRSQSTFHKPLN